MKVYYCFVALLTRSSNCFIASASRLAESTGETASDTGLETAFPSMLCMAATRLILCVEATTAAANATITTTPPTAIPVMAAVESGGEEEGELVVVTLLLLRIGPGIGIVGVVGLVVVLVTFVVLLVEIVATMIVAEGHETPPLPVSGSH